ncbi:MAG: aminoacyl-tRNA hydrolase [Elusimicrobia bacterium]|nr:aminoacyl-tRNA hydrolase [Candidatus Liberimonas magnetica]
MADIKIIVGLGNPGEKYKKTRHNIGFRVVELLAEKENQKWKEFHAIAELSSFYTDGNKIILVKPVLFMNNSGLAVRQLLEYFNILPSQMLVVVDDFAIPLGKLRLRERGSSGGHNGLESIIEHLATPDFPRLRLGLGPVELNTDPKDFVLGKFTRDENLLVKPMVEEALNVVSNIFKLGFAKAVSKIRVLENPNNL